MTPRFALRRQRYQDLPLTATSDDDLQRVEAELGGQPEWFWGVPGVFRALASPSTSQSIPAAPTNRDPHEQALSYWAALHYLLLHRLGWSDPARGLRWWYDSGKPTEDLTLALVSEVWHRDGNLDAYLAWLLDGQLKFSAAGANVPEWPSERVELSPEWQRWQEGVTSRLTAMRDAGVNTWQPWGGGWDPLHLSGHSGESGRPDPSSTLTITSRAQRSAVFLTNTMDAWYRDLNDKAKALPDIGHHSWRVDVIVRPVGFLGTYRQSRETGRWFVGRHSIHIQGS